MESVLQLDQLKKGLKKAKRQVKVLSAISNETKSLVMSGIKPIWNAKDQCTVNGDIVSASYETHRALLLLYRFNNRSVQPTQEKEIETLEDIDCSML